MNSFLEFKPFILALDSKIKALSKEELHGLLMGVGQKLRPEERQMFLDQFQKSPEKNAGVIFQKLADHHPLLQKIQVWVKRMEERASKIESGEIWNEREYQNLKGRDWYERKDPELFNENHEEKLREFLANAHDYFLNGEFAAARDLYEELLFVGQERDYWHIHPLDKDQETWSRYIRSVYEIRKEYPHPMESLFRVLTERRSKEGRSDAPKHQKMTWDDRTPDFSTEAFYVSWIAVENSFPKQIDFPENFFTDWESFLKKKASVENDRRAFYRLLESIYHRKEEVMLGTVVREFSAVFPQGWRYWTQRLIQEGRICDYKMVAQEAISFLEMNPSAETILEALCRDLRLVVRSEKEQEPEMKLVQRIFRLTKRDEDWLLRMNLAKEMGRAEEELELILEELGKEKHQRLRWKTLLALGRLEEVFNLREGDWSDERWDLRDLQKFLAPVFMAFLQGSPPSEGSALRQWLREEVDRDGYLSESIPLSGSISMWVLEKISGYRVGDELRKPWMSLAKSIGLEEVEQILSQRNRASYSKAAMIIAGIAQGLVGIEAESPEAREMIQETVYLKYRRLSAFKGEWREWMKKSGLEALITEKAG